MTATLDAPARSSHKPPRRVQLSSDVSVVVAADIDAVWNVVSDVTRVGEWSHECVGAEWLDGSTAPVPGARFRGRNKARVFRWGRVCEIVSADPYEIAWFTIPAWRTPDSTEWRISLEAVDGGTKITQRYNVRKAPKAVSFLFALLVPAHRDRDEAITGDLRRIGEVALKR